MGLLIMSISGPRGPEIPQDYIRLRVKRQEKVRGRGWEMVVVGQEKVFNTDHSPFHTFHLVIGDNNIYAILPSIGAGQRDPQVSEVCLRKKICMIETGTELGLNRWLISLLLSPNLRSLCKYLKMENCTGCSLPEFTEGKSREGS